MAHPVKMITYQDLHKLNHSIQQLKNWHETFSLLKNKPHTHSIPDNLFYEHERILKTLTQETHKLKTKEKLKNILI
ncbi:hypothetical protein [Enterococcus caccae]|uniref:Uncharacterized protein n=1 Tax=Enterococcus caccae ATCC BAA-1240 TaxID=1158612 RepID=R3UAA8_9ENTE|nr:hypothetical protein [Enterococcus caccae]EOL50373.1 hypothetical protein UC7_00366 [Enterococcus caccae ATCC BAA-1240]EOT59190.1 hypothetical protein I580_02222 [Enterococcus caccae ATCC BAA-1240]OJG25722.1 hypothetical protein RU98_GL000963 [Enterococcus caccae]